MSSQNYDLASHISYVVCVNFYTRVTEPRVLSRQIFHVNFIYSLSFCQKFAERQFLYFVLMVIYDLCFKLWPHLYAGCLLYIGIREQKQILIIENRFIVFQNIIPIKISRILHAFELIVEALLPL